MADHHMTLPQIFRLSFPAGLALLDARAARLNPSSGFGFIDRHIVAARNRCRRELSRLYRII